MIPLPRRGDDILPWARGVTDAVNGAAIGPAGALVRQDGSGGVAFAPLPDNRRDRRDVRIYPFAVAWGLVGQDTAKEEKLIVWLPAGSLVVADEQCAVTDSSGAALETPGAPYAAGWFVVPGLPATPTAVWLSVFVPATCPRSSSSTAFACLGGSAVAADANHIRIAALKICDISNSRITQLVAGSLAFVTPSSSNPDGVTLSTRTNGALQIYGADQYNSPADTGSAVEMVSLINGSVSLGVQDDRRYVFPALHLEANSTPRLEWCRVGIFPFDDKSLEFNDSSGVKAQIVGFGAADAVSATNGRLFIVKQGSTGKIAYVDEANMGTTLDVVTGIEFDTTTHQIVAHRERVRVLATVQALDDQTIPTTPLSAEPSSS